MSDHWVSEPIYTVGSDLGLFQKPYDFYQCAEGRKEEGEGKTDESDPLACGAPNICSSNLSARLGECFSESRSNVAV